MKFSKSILAVVLIAMSQAVMASGGVTLGSTRVVYDGNKDEASVTVRNKDTDKYYLIQTLVEPKDGVKAPFSITPPLFRLNAGKTNMLRIIGKTGQLPLDRESVYWLNVKAIPEAPAATNTLQVAIQTRIKLFYRPKNLSQGVEAAQSQLQWSHKGEELIVKNPTPYAISFSDITVSGKKVDNLEMVLPKDEQHFILPNGTQNAVNLTYTTITDFGGTYPETTAHIQ